MRRQGARVGYIDGDVGGFRIHVDSISGSGRAITAYRDDLKRMFHEEYGRDWQLTDALWKFMYRLEGAAIRGGALFSRTAKREIE